jgi:hypothetical protein
MASFTLGHGTYVFPFSIPVGNVPCMRYESLFANNSSQFLVSSSVGML